MSFPSLKKNTPSKVKRSIVRTFLIAGVLPIMAMSITAILILREQMAERYEEQTLTEARRVASILYDATTSVFTASETMINNNNCKQLFGTDSMTDSMQEMYDSIADSMRSYRENSASISKICIYTDNPVIPDSEYIVGGINLSEAEFPIPEDDTIWNSWSAMTSSDIWMHDNYELVLVRRIGIVSQKYRAYFMITMDNNNLKNRMDQSTYQVIADINHMESFYSSTREYQQAHMPLPEEESGTSSASNPLITYTGVLDYNGTSLLTCIRSFRPYNTEDIFYVSVSDPAALTTIAQLTRILLILLLISCMIPLLIILSYANFFSNRIDTLKTAMHKASEGDYNIMDEVRGDDELSETFLDLKKTVDLIHQQEADYYEAKITEQKLINQQQQMEYSVLANQINPHFLYNTLETIRMLSLASGDRKAANAIKLLGKSMRYVLDNNGTSFVPLSAELDYIRTYLSIQELRFGERVHDRIEIAKDVDPEQYRILPLLLQPVVENAISHGLEGMDSGGLVTIQIHLESFSETHAEHIAASTTETMENRKNNFSENTPDQDLVIRIEDNGCGMDSDTLESLLYKIQHRDPSSGRHVGLYNINRRLKLLYKDRAKLTVSSRLNEGTILVIRFPAEDI